MVDIAYIYALYKFILELMTIKDLFSVILKVLGIYFLKDVVISLPTLFSVIVSFFHSDVEGIIVTSLLSLTSIFVYCCIIYLLVFKTDWVISKFRLTDDFSVEPLKINLHRSTVVTIAVIFTGVIIVTQAIPGIVSEVVQFFQYRRQMRGLLQFDKPFEYTWVIVNVGELIIGISLIIYNKYIVNLIEYRRRDSGE